MDIKDEVSFIVIRFSVMIMLHVKFMKGILLALKGRYELCVHDNE